MTKETFAERLEQVTTRLNGINTLKPVIDDYIHALFRLKTDSGLFSFITYGFK